MTDWSYWKGRTIGWLKIRFGEWAIILFGTIGFGVLFVGLGILFSYVIFAIPSRWDGAVVLKICRDGTPILRDRDGEIWARRSAVIAYRVEDSERVCQP